MARPVVTVRRGGISVAIWENDRDDGKGKSYSAKIEKRYKDRSGEWQDSPYFFESDLLVVAELCRAAWHKIGARNAPPDKAAPPARKKKGGKDPGDDIPF
jgi:hypothetical protein